MKWINSQNELKELYKQNRVMVYDYKTLYQVNYSMAQQQYYVTKIKTTGDNSKYTIRGRILAVTPEEVK